MMSIVLYRFFRFITFPFYWIALRFRHRDDKSKFHEKIGRPTEDRPKGDLVWVHVDDYAKADEIVKGLLANMPDMTVLLTYNIRQNAAHNRDPKVICQFVPMDTKLACKNFLGFWEPSFAIMLGLGLRPNQQFMLKKMEIPSFLVNGQVSGKVYKRLKWIRRAVRKVVREFTFVWATDNKQVLLLANLGATNIESMELLPGPNKIKDISVKIKTMLK